MDIRMQPVSVAIAGADRDQCSGYERLLQGEFGISLLADVATSQDSGKYLTFLNRRLRARTDVTVCEQEVARIKRLKPLVLLVNVNRYSDEDCELLLSLRRECPEVLIVLLADDSVHEDLIMHGLEIGARGYLKYASVQLHLTMAIQMVGYGEAWVPRRMLGNIMDRILH